MKTVALVSNETKHAGTLWRNGQIVPWDEACVHVRSVGHASVSAVFEGIKAYWNQEQGELYAFRLREHMRRLHDSTRIVRLANRFTVDELVQGAVAILRANQTREDTYLRPWTFIEGVVYEQIAPADPPTETVIDTWPFKSSMLQERGCRVCVSSWTRISDNACPPRVKAFANYHNGRMGAIEATASGYDWPVFLNDRGKVTEGPGACIGLVRNSTLITPNLSSGILESVTRDSVLELARTSLGIPVVEREVDRTELYVADELFYMGTGWEILPILSVDGLPVGAGTMGPVSRAIDQVYHGVVRGLDSAYRHWLTPVWGRG